MSTLSWGLLLVLVGGFGGSRVVDARAERLLSQEERSRLTHDGRGMRRVRFVTLLGMVALIYLLPLGAAVLLPFFLLATHLYSDRLFLQLGLPEAFRRRMMASNLLIGAAILVDVLAVLIPGWTTARQG